MFILAPSRYPGVNNTLRYCDFPTIKCGLCYWPSPGLLAIWSRSPTDTLIRIVNETIRAQWDVYFGTKQVSRGQKHTEIWRFFYHQMWIKFMAFPWSFGNLKHFAHWHFDSNSKWNDQSSMRCSFWHHAGLQRSKTHWAVAISLPSNVDYVNGFPLVFWQFKAYRPLPHWVE